MGLICNEPEAIGYAAPTRATDAAGDEQRTAEQLNVARSWAGLTTRGHIFISIEQLAQGQDAVVLVSHETAHDVLLQSSVLGLQQLGFSAFGMPPWPPGRVQRTARRLLAESVSVSVRTHEGCATFLPSLDRDADDLAAYWAQLPDSYRAMAEPLEWLRGRSLDTATKQNLVFALGGFALGVRVPSECLGELRAARAFMDDAARRPDDRFVVACTALASADDDELRALVTARQPEQDIAERWYQRGAGVVAEYTPAASPGARWVELWQELVMDMAARWSADPQLPEDERTMLLEAAQQAVMLLPPPGPGVLKASLTHTVSLHGGVADHPPIGSLLAHELVLISYNSFSTPLPGVQSVDGDGLPLAPGDAALWLASPNKGHAAARLSEVELRDYLAAAHPDTTIGIYDGTYMFPEGDLLAAAPLVRDRPHLVLVEQRSLGALIDDALLSMGLAGDTEVRYAVIGGDTPGVSYFVVSPASQRYPILVVPVPWPTAKRAVRDLETFTLPNLDGLRWTKVDPERFFTDDPTAALHLIRLFAWFEDKPWPPQTIRPTDDSHREPQPRDHLGLGAPPDSSHAGGDAFARLDRKVRAKLDAVGGLEAQGRLLDAERGYSVDGPQGSKGCRSLRSSPGVPVRTPGTHRRGRSRLHHSTRDDRPRPWSAGGALPGADPPDRTASRGGRGPPGRGTIPPPRPCTARSTPPRHAGQLDRTRHPGSRSLPVGRRQPPPQRRPRSRTSPQAGCLSTSPFKPIGSAIITGPPHGCGWMTDCSGPRVISSGLHLTRMLPYA